MGRTEESVHPEPTFPDVVTRTGSTETRSASGAIGRCSPYSVIFQCFHATVESLRVKDAEPTGSGWLISAKTSSTYPTGWKPIFIYACLPGARIPLCTAWSGPALRGLIQQQTLTLGPPPERHALSFSNGQSLFAGRAQG